jgi:hypothetical protein
VTVAETRTIDPEVANRRARLAGLTSRKAPAETIEKARQELDEANRLAAIKAAVKNAPPLSPEVRDSIVGMLHAAGDQ